MDHHDASAAQAGDVRRGDGQAEGGGDGRVHGIAPLAHDVVAHARAGVVVGDGRVGLMLRR